MTRLKPPAAGHRARRATLAIVASLLPFAMAGCGGDEGADPKPRGGGDTTVRSSGPGTPRGSAKDAKAIREVLVRAFKSDDSDVTCTRIFTANLLRQIYGDKAGCRRAEAEGQDEKDPERVAVSMIGVDGRRATARIRLVGGDSAGTNGVLALATEGRGWRLDNLSLGFLHSAFTAGLATDKSIAREVARCMDTRIMRMPDRAFKDFAFRSIGKKPEAQRRLATLLSRCERATGRMSTVRREFQKGITKSLREAGAGRRVIDCVTRRLRRGVSDEALIALAGMKRVRQRARVRRLVLAALSACGARDADDRLRQAA